MNRRASVAIAVAYWSVMVYLSSEARSQEIQNGRSTAAIESESANQAYVPPEWPEAPDTGSMLIRLVTGTVTVLVMCVLTLVVGRRWLGGTTTQTGAGQLQIVETVSLGHRCSIHLMRAGAHRIIVGVDGSGLKSVLALPDTFENTLSEAQDDAPDEVSVRAEPAATENILSVSAASA